MWLVVAMIRNSTAKLASHITRPARMYNGWKWPESVLAMIVDRIVKKKIAINLIHKPAGMLICKQNKRCKILP